MTGRHATYKAKENCPCNCFFLCQFEHILYAVSIPVCVKTSLRNEINKAAEKRRSY